MFLIITRIEVNTIAAWLVSGSTLSFLTANSISARHNYFDNDCSDIGIPEIGIVHAQHRLFDIDKMALCEKCAYKQCKMCTFINNKRTGLPNIAEQIQCDVMRYSDN